MSKVLLIDFGSTYTKAVAVDLDMEEIIGASQAPTTVEKDITIGLTEALEKLFQTAGETEFMYKLACSSAAGGLRMVAVGYVKELTAEASNKAALGAGAKVVDVFSYGLDDQELDRIVTINPDIILLSGGTDGGNRNVIIQNAEIIAKSSLQAPVIVAGNEKATSTVTKILCNGGKEVIIAENVMPDLNLLNLEPARAAIREVFMRRIVSAKGLDRAKQFIDGVLMPTPMAVLNAAKLLAEGTKQEEGLGELIIVDVGGATTDIHSVANERHFNNAILRGLPEPYVKRTVEGDLGIRYNALSILDLAGEEKILSNGGISIQLSKDLLSYIKLVSSVTNKVPQNNVEAKFDLGLSRTALECAIGRHAGIIEELYTSNGLVYIQKGKDLRGVKTLIGTGGFFSHNSYALQALRGALNNANDPFSLKPKRSELYLDNMYILFGVGLLAEVAPTTALRLAKKSLEKKAIPITQEAEPWRRKN